MEKRSESNDFKKGNKKTLVKTNNFVNVKGWSRFGNTPSKRLVFSVFAKA